ncbi:MAG: alpha/beta fold hydrolase [Nanoarchaeota archaeon]
MDAQRVNFPNKEGKNLAGLLQFPTAQNPPLVIISPVLRGDKQYSPVMDRASQTFSDEGYAVLRYDVAGFGNSEGHSEDMTITSQVNDLEQAITYARSLPVDSSHIGLVGFSIGSTCAILNANQKGVRALALWSPPFNHRFLAERYLVHAAAVADKGYFESIASLNGRTYRTGKAFLEECKTFDLTDRLKELRVPVLAIHAGNDSLIGLEKVTTHMPMITQSPTRIVDVPGADHDFSVESSQPIVIQETKEWFNRYVNP